MKAKRTIAGALALSMLVTAAASINVSAADATVTLKASHEKVAAAGDTFTMNVSLEDIPSTKINVLDFALTYDTDVLTIDDVLLGDSAAVDTSDDTTAVDAPIFSYKINDDGEIAISWTTGLTSAAWISTDGVILTLKGTVNDGVANGTVTPVDFAPVTRETYEGSNVKNESMLIGFVYGTDSAEYGINKEAGSVTVGDAVVTTGATTSAGDDETTTTAAETTVASVVTTNESGEQTTEGTVGGTTETNQGQGNVTKRLYGDVNCDGRVDISDAVLLNKKVADAVQLNEQAVLNADCDGNEEINSNDAMVLLKFLVSLIKSLPYKG